MFIACHLNKKCLGLVIFSNLTTGVLNVVLLFCLIFFFSCCKVSIHSIWLGNNITPLREEEWGEDEEDENDVPAPSSPPTSPINTRCLIFSFLSFDLAISFYLFMLSSINWLYKLDTGK